MHREKGEQDREMDNDKRGEQNTVVFTGRLWNQ